MSRSIHFAPFVMITAAITGCGIFERSPQSAASSDAFFAKQASAMNHAEIELGELALRRSGNERVTDYARMLVDDHRSAQSRLVPIAQRYGIDLPDEPDPNSRKAKDHLAAIEISEFDREFMSAMAADHAKAVTMFRDKARSLDNPELRAWAEQQIAGLEHHHSMAANLSADLGNAPPVLVHQSR